MLKKCILFAVTAVFCVLQFAVDAANATEVAPELRTVTLNESGEQVTLTLKEVAEGKRVFNNVCAQCHAGGVTKTSPDLDLSTETLALAFPARDNIDGLIDYMQNPTTFDGEVEIYEYHPSTRSADIFPEMRNLTDDELYAVAGHILSQPKILGKRWGAGKTKYST